jgi:hypothetical protein
MSLASYSDLTTALGAWLDHSLYSSYYANFIALFEAMRGFAMPVRSRLWIVAMFP